MKDRFTHPKSAVVDRASFLVEQCRGKTVLHLGCTDWPITESKLKSGAFLHARLAEVASSLTGVDADPDGVAYLKKNGCPDTHIDNVEIFSNPALQGRTFDRIVAGEIIEHLNNPGLFLNAVQKLMGPETELIVTTVNAYCLFRFLRYLAGKELVHEDHNYYFSPRVLEKLITRNKLTISSFRYYGIGKELRKAVPTHFLIIDWFTSRIFPPCSDGVIFSARLCR